MKKKIITLMHNQKFIPSQPFLIVMLSLVCQLI